MLANSVNTKNMFDDTHACRADDRRSAVLFK